MAVLTAALLLFAPSLGAQVQVPVAVALGACAPLERADVERLLRVELGERLAEAPRGLFYRIEVGCNAGLVTVEVSALGGESGEIRRGRRLLPEDVSGDVGARVLVLQTMELLREVELRYAELSVVPPFPDQKGEAAANPERQRRTRTEPGAMTAVVGAKLLSFGLDAPLVGGELLLERDLKRWLYVRSGVALMARDKPQGQVATFTRIVLLRGELGWHHDSDSQAFGVGAGVRYARASIRGQSEVAGQPTGTVMSGLWGVYAAAFFDTRIKGPVIGRISLEGGHTTSTLRGRVAGGDDVIVGGLWTEAFLGVGVEF